MKEKEKEKRKKKKNSGKASSLNMEYQSMFCEPEYPKGLES